VHQIRLFKHVETEIRDMEKEINDWLKKTNARVVQVCGNIAPQSAKDNSPSGSSGRKQFGASDLFVAVVYDT
jgi:hypothetical protein